jgi:hypothetical protein
MVVCQAVALQGLSSNLSEQTLYMDRDIVKSCKKSCGIALKHNQRGLQNSNFEQGGEIPPYPQ